jgi:hypothetical protein
MIDHALAGFLGNPRAAGALTIALLAWLCLATARRL